MTREEAYDSKIAPLMTQIIALCKEHDIPMIAQYQIDDDREAGDDSDALLCSTSLTGGPEAETFANTCDHLRRLAARLRPKPPEWGAFTVYPDGTRTKVAGSDMP